MKNFRYYVFPCGSKIDICGSKDDVPVAAFAYEAHAEQFGESLWPGYYEIREINAEAGRTEVRGSAKSIVKTEEKKETP